MAEATAVVAPPDLRNENFDASQAIQKPTRKRKRIVISCTECHRRKQKCDRLLPCSNCITRNKQEACRYETEPTTKRQTNNDATNGSSEDERISPGAANTIGVQNIKLGGLDGTSQLSALGYSKVDGHNTLGFFKKIESLDGEQNATLSAAGQRQAYNGLREKYKNLVRQLPPKAQLDLLLDTFFDHINYIYSSVNKDIFMDALQGWNNIPFSVINRGPQDIPKELRYFPALLFQVLALALQFQDVDHDPSLNALKYAPGMSLDDLAADYSESAAALLALLPKRDLTLFGVQAAFLRTSFLKNIGAVVESWHSLGRTIRDAQEIGIHKDRVESKPQNPEQALEQMWQLEDRRRMWMALRMWDAHMALVLGRPTAIDRHNDKVSPPADTPITHNRRTAAPIPRSVADPPTPLTALIANCIVCKPLEDVLDLQKEGAYPKDYTKVEQIHQDILQRRDALPPFLRLENPDTTFDAIPECDWLPLTRWTVESSWNFCIMNLHRPYVFTIKKSRTEALKGALGVLRAQREHFQRINARHYKMFSLVFSTFDACVLIAAVYILHPTENMDYLDASLQHIDWAKERFEVMQDRSPTARAALGVLKAVQVRLLKALGARHVSSQPSTGQTFASTSSVPKESPASTVSSTNISQPSSTGEATTASTNSSNMDYNMDGSGVSNLPAPFSIPDKSGLDGSLSSTNHAILDTGNIAVNTDPALAGSLLGVNTSSSDWSTSTNFLIPDNFDFSALEPLAPTRDLVFNDLVGMSNIPAPTVAANAQTFYDATQPWQFEGEFEDDSFWNFMNQYNP